MLSKLNTIEEALEDIRKGKVVIVVDDEDRENEGDFVAAAEMTTPEMINFMATHGRGLICTPILEERADALNLEMMVGKNTDPNQTQFTVSVDLIGAGCTTGISASDRAKTVLALIDEKTKPEDLGRPGHIFPLKAKKGGVLRRTGHTEASVDLARLAGLKPAGVIVEIMNEDGTMAKGQDLFNFAKKHKLKIGKIEDLISYRLKKEKLIKLKKSSDIKVKKQKYKIKIYENLLDGSEHFALVKGTIKKGIIPRVRVISSNVVHNYLINQQLPNSFDKTLNYFKKFNNCVLVFIKDTNLKSVTQTLKDYKNKDFYKKGNDKLIRNYGIGAQIIKDLKIKNMILITKSLKKVIGLEGYDIKITKQEII